MRSIDDSLSLIAEAKASNDRYLAERAARMAGSSMTAEKLRELLRLNDILLLSVLRLEKDEAKQLEAIAIHREATAKLVAPGLRLVSSEVRT